MKIKKLFLIICTICFAAALACGVAACGEKTKEPSDIEVVSISIEPASASVYVDESVTLTAKINPVNATDKTVTWTSSAPAIAVVDNDGKVTGKSKGDAIIYASAGGKQAECKVTVSVKPYTAVNSVSLNHDSLTMMVGEEFTNLIPTILPADATNRTEHWQSSDPECVEVSDKGILTAKAAGTAKITLTVDGKSAHCDVTVTEKIEIEQITLTPDNIIIDINKTATLTANVTPEVDAELIVWDTKDPAVATVAGGVVTAVGKGTTTITATIGGKSAECLVTVNVPVQGISLNQKVLTITVLDSATLSVDIEPSNATNQNVSWESSDPTVATVVNGVVRALKVGTTTITASLEGKSDTCEVTVTDEPHVSVTKVTLDKTHLDLKVGDNETLTATVEPSDATNPAVSWKSSDTSVVTVVGGAVKALKAGTATITASAENESATCTVTVTDIEVESVTLNKNSLELKVGEGETLTADYSPSNATSVEYFWSSSDPSVATVEDGEVTALKVGETTITVTVGGKSATCLVTVIDNEQGGGGDGEEDDEPVETIITYAHAGEEMAAFEWKDTNAANAKVEYKLSSSSSYTRIDSQLIRQITPEIVRADIVGLKGNAKHDFKITASDGTVEYVKEVDIAALDRSGYAHVGAGDGVGAYKNDGTLKSNAKVIYLTEANKNDIDGNGTSIAEYLAKASSVSTPIVIRVVGLVGSATWQELKYRALVDKDDYLRAEEVKGLNGEQLPKGETKQADLIGTYNNLNYYPEKLGGDVYCAPIDGLNSKVTFTKADPEKPESHDAYDSCWNDCKVSGGKNITVEGIGEDAEIFQWGFTFVNCNSIEVRNIRFWDYTEDACSFEGNATKDTAIDNFNHKNFWVHHNIFDLGMNYWDVCDEQDKKDGDGATDFKKLAYVTVAYNRYNGTHKTGLVGGGDTHYQAAFTFHHNYYNSCDQRMPLGRQANMHLYNNYFSNSGLYSVSLRAGAYAYIENCVFTSKSSSTRPIEILKGDTKNGTPSVKVVDCDMQGSIKNEISGENNVYIGDRAGATDVEGGNLYGLNFDNNMPYTIQAGTKLETADIRTDIPLLAGTLKRVKNIDIAGSTGGEEEGDDTPTISPDADKVTASIDSAVAAGKLTVSSDKQDLTNVPIVDGITFTAKQTTVSRNDTAVEFDDGYSFYHRVVLGKYSSSNQRYFTITTSGAATIKVYAVNMGSSDDRNIGLYTNKDATNTLIGSTTSFNQGDKKIVTISVSAGGTYYLLATSSGSSADLSIFAIDIVENGGSGGETSPSATTYKYDCSGNSVGDWSTDASVGTNSGNSGLQLSEGKKLTLTASGNKATISMTGFTTGTSGTAKYLQITLLDSNGNSVGTVDALTPADKALGNYTFNGSTTVTLTASGAFASIEVSFIGDSGKSTYISTLTIVVE